MDLTKYYNLLINLNQEAKFKKLSVNFIYEDISICQDYDTKFFYVKNGNLFLTWI